MLVKMDAYFITGQIRQCFRALKTWEYQIKLLSKDLSLQITMLRFQHLECTLLQSKLLHKTLLDDLYNRKANPIKGL